MITVTPTSILSFLDPCVLAVTITAQIMIISSKHVSHPEEQHSNATKYHAQGDALAYIYKEAT